MSLREHLNELKHRVKWIAAAYFVSLAFWLLWPVGDFSVDALFTGLYRPLIAIVLDAARGLATGRVTIIAGSLTSPLEIYFIASAVMALITASPVIGYETYKFVDPALHQSERSTIYKFMTAFLGLFTAGAVVAWFLLMPAIIRFLVYFSNVVGAQPVITAGDYYGMVLIAVGATAIAFTTPAIFLLLVNFGIVSTNALAKNRLLVYLGLYILIAVITPEPVVGHFGMFFPIVIMLEASIRIGKRMEKTRAQKSGSGSQKIEDKCKYCGGELELGKHFCLACGRAQA